MSGYLAAPLKFLITTIFDLYILAVVLRLLLQWARADFFNPVSQFIVKITNPPLVRMRRFIPSIGGLDTSSLLLALFLQMALLAVAGSYRPLLPGLIDGTMMPLFALFGLAVLQLVNLGFNIFIYGIIILVILSWVSPGTYNPVAAVLASLTEPLLRPARQLIPPMGGLDLSPLVVIIALQVLKMLVIPPLQHLLL